ncbi:MAG: GNAT family N-acetyltransferase [Pseudomonadota bacterium]|nr:GNAT family N-acetyltransferase [Pseudomonadota bacterium]
MSIEYRPLAGADLDARQGLFHLSFPETVGRPAGSQSHYTWKFRESPGDPPAYEFVGHDDGTLVAYYAALPFTYRIDGVTRTAGMVCDVMTHPTWRGQGLFTGIGRYATTELAESGLAIVTGYPVRPEVLPGHLKVGWKIVQRMPVWLRPLRTRSLLPKRFSFLAPLFDPWLWLLQWRGGFTAGYEVRTMSAEAFLSPDRPSGDYADFLERWSAAVPNALAKDFDFLRWRLRAPGTGYQIALLHFAGRLVGMAIARPTELQGIRCLALLDVMIEPEGLQGAARLHHALASMARTSGLDAVACMAHRRWARSYRFCAAGYLRTPAVFSLIVKKLDPELPDASVYSEDRWHVFWLDSDDL